MTNKIIKNNKKGGPAPYEAKGFHSGFVMLFAVTLSAILLSIALGVTNIAFKELRFSTNARDTNDAFFAADTGAEYALFEDIKNSSYQVFPGVRTKYSPSPINNLGGTNVSCAKVIIIKDDTIPPMKTTIISKGHNKTIGGNCDSSSDIVERQIEVNY